MQCFNGQMQNSDRFGLHSIQLKLWNRTLWLSSNHRKQALLVSTISLAIIKGLRRRARELGLVGVESLQDGEGES